MAVMFGRTKLSRFPKLKIDETAVGWMNKTKYLGITISIGPGGPREPSMWDYIINNVLIDMFWPSDQQK